MARDAPSPTTGLDPGSVSLGLLAWGAGEEMCHGVGGLTRLLPPVTSKSPFLSLMTPIVRSVSEKAF